MTNLTSEADLSQDIIDIFGLGEDVSSAPQAASGEAPAAPGPAGEEGAAPASSAPAAPSSTEVPQGQEAGAAQPAAAPQQEEPQPAAPLALAPLQQAPAAPAQPSQADANMELVALKAQVQQLLAERQAAQPAPQQQGAPGAPPAPQGTGEQEEAPRYSLTIPDQVSQAIFSEDPATAKQGMEHLVNGLAIVIHTNLRKEFQANIQQLESARQTQVQQEQEQAQRQAAIDKYYGSFPTHRDPTVMQIVAAENAALAAQFPGHPFDDAYIGALGTRVNAKLQALSGAQTAPAAPAAVPVPPRPAPMMPSAPSAGGNIPAFERQQDEIADTFSFG